MRVADPLAQTPGEFQAIVQIFRQAAARPGMGRGDRPREGHPVPLQPHTEFQCLSAKRFDMVDQVEGRRHQPRAPAFSEVQNPVTALPGRTAALISSRLEPGAHPHKEVRGDPGVGIHDHEAIGRGRPGQEVGDGIVQSIALPTRLGLSPLQDRHPIRTRQGRRRIGAVIGDDDHLETLIGIVLLAQTIQRTGQDKLLIVGGDDHGQGQGPAGLGRRSGAPAREGGRQQEQ